MTAIPLAQADRMAAKIVAKLRPFCERIEIAGSIRRRRLFVGDIDLVVLSADGRLSELLDRVLRTTIVITDGLEVLLVRLSNAVQLDLWIEKPDRQELFGRRPSNLGTLHRRPKHESL